MPHIAGPNHTQIPNVILESMAQMGNAELRVVLAVCRKTFGWQKRKDQLSLSQLSNLTGLSRRGTIDGITAALDNEWIIRTKRGQSFLYSVNLLHQSEDETSEDTSLELVKPLHQLDDKLVKVVDTQKKEFKEISKEKRARAKDARANSVIFPIAKALAEVCQMSLEANPSLFRDAKLLSKAVPAPTPELIHKNYNGDPRAFWKSQDYRGKKGERPTPYAIRETWIAACGTGIGAAKKESWTPEQAAAMKAELKRVQEIQ